MDSGRAEKHDQLKRRVCVACPKCGQGYRVAAQFLGKKLACRHCHHEWRSTEVDAQELRRLTQATSTTSSNPPSDSTQHVLPEDLPPIAGSSSTVIDTSWTGRKLGRYKVLAILGQGGMGVVWRGHDETLRRDVALKFLTERRRSTTGPSLNTALFMQEARAVAKLQHPYVVSIYEVGEDQGQVFLALELMEGGTLKEYVDRNGPVPAKDLFAMMVGPAKALGLAHRHGHLKLMDFGLADVAQEEASQRMRGKAVGSLGWVAPETVKALPTTAASDIYSFGLVMVFALLGKPWLHAESRSKLLALHQSPPTLDAAQLRGLSPRAVQMLKKCLAVDPTERFETAEELAAELLACAEEDPMAKIERRRSYASIAAVAAIAGLFVGVGAVATYFLQLAEKANEMSMPVAQYRVGNRPNPQPPAPHAPPQHFESVADAQVPWPEVPDLVDPDALSFIASTQGQEFHWPECPKAREILASQLRNFDNYAQAIEAGVKPCPLCRPAPGPRPEFIMSRDRSGEED
jgi:hypothetical protein